MKAYLQHLTKIVNPEWLWVTKIVLIFIAIIAIYFIWAVLEKSLEKHAQKESSFLSKVLLQATTKPLHFFIIAMGLALITEAIVRAFLPQVNVVFIVEAEKLIFLLALTWFLLNLISRAQHNFVVRETSRFDHATILALAKIAQIFVGFIMLLIILQTLGIRISGLLAFGGIGGAAVALASKDLLSNFFGGFVIYMDKPFVIGDYIQTSDQKIAGTVEQIGWRATRIRTMDKYVVYVPNSLFTVTAVENLSCMTHRRIKMIVSVRYQDVSKIVTITDKIREYLFQHPKVEKNERIVANFINFGSSSLDIDLEMWIKEIDNMTFKKIQQDIFLNVLEIIRAEGADCPFPTMTLDLPNDVRISTMLLPEYIKTVYEKSKCLYTNTEIEEALDRMAVAIHEKISDKNPLLLCVMVGGLVPAGNLLHRLDFPLELDYVHATRYQSGTRGRELTWKARPRSALKDRTILVIDDILDGGVTLAAIVEHCREEGAREVLTAVLVNKRNARLPEGLPIADFVGLEVENRYVFGYGLDYKEYLRNAPGIYEVAAEHE